MPNMSDNGGDGPLRICVSDEIEGAPFSASGPDDGGSTQAASSLRIALERARARVLWQRSDEDHAVVWTWDLATHRFELQESVDGTGPSSTRGCDPADFLLDVHEHDRARVVEALHAVVDGRLGCAAVKHRARCANGAMVHVLTRAVAVRDRRGQVRMVVGMTRELAASDGMDQQRIAHLRRLEAIAGVSRAVMQAGLSLPEILQEVARSIAAFAGGLCAVRLLSEDRRVLEAPAACAHIDESRRLVVLEALGHPQPAHGGVVARAVDGGSCIQVSGQDLAARYLEDEAPGVPEVVVLVPLRSRGDVTGLLVVGRDHGCAFDDEDLHVLQELADVAGHAISNARLHARAERLLRVTETFVGVLGHDLRNPLGAITTCAQLVLRSDDVERNRRAATRIERSAARMARMIEQLLDFTRMRVGRLSLERGPVDAAEVCSDVMDELREVHPRRDVQLRILGDARGEWDAARLGQLISNLVGNAIDHGDPETPITVLVDGILRDVVRIDVHSGGAIPLLRLSTIFEPMGPRAAVGDSRAARRNGLGLGLFIVKQIALAHGGDATVASSSGAGTTFSVTLPRGRRSDA